MCYSTLPSKIFPPFSFPFHLLFTSFSVSLALTISVFLFLYALSRDGAGSRRLAAHFPRRWQKSRRSWLRWPRGCAAVGLLRQNRRRSEADSGDRHRHDLRRLLQFRRISSQITWRSYQRLRRTASEQSRRSFQLGSAQGSSFSLYTVTFASSIYCLWKFNLFEVLVNYALQVMFCLDINLCIKHLQQIKLRRKCVLRSLNFNLGRKLINFSFLFFFLLICGEVYLKP